MAPRSLRGPDEPYFLETRVTSSLPRTLPWYRIRFLSLTNKWERTLQCLNVKIVDLYNNFSTSQKIEYSHRGRGLLGGTLTRRHPSTNGRCLGSRRTVFVHTLPPPTPSTDIFRSPWKEGPRGSSWSRWSNSGDDRDDIPEDTPHLPYRVRPVRPLTSHDMDSLFYYFFSVSLLLSKGIPSSRRR